ncbi:hypothetical protein SAMN05443245_6374 [Paraburkholderia fungorum]|uniref:Uncharacterized protein n=1 Tax=Paraburkholderia fungorum TaxID=134537 RepID=A0A1H1JGW6_9BURK|nr:hypothetical protein SAMN05443245_6374 [Paraburkholderia fungorum]
MAAAHTALCRAVDAIQIGLHLKTSKPYAREALANGSVTPTSSILNYAKFGMNHVRQLPLRNINMR